MVARLASLASALSLSLLVGLSVGAGDAAAYTGPPPWDGSGGLSALKTLLTTPNSGEAVGGALLDESATGLAAARAGAGVMPALTATNIGAMGAALTAGWFIGSGVNRFVGISAAVTGYPAVGGPITNVDGWIAINAPMGDPYEVGPWIYGNGLGPGWVLQVDTTGIANSRWGASGCTSPDRASEYSYFNSQTVGTVYSGALGCSPNPPEIYNFRAIPETDLLSYVTLRTAIAGPSTPGGTTSYQSGFTPADISASGLSSAPIVAARNALGAMGPAAQLEVGQLIDPAWEGPPPAEFTMPDCTGLTYSACVDLLSAEGFIGTIITAELDQQSADLGYGGGRVVSTDPVSGTGSIGLEDTVTFNTNPDPLPLELQAQLANESAADYLTRIGFTGTVTYVDLTPDLSDPSLGPSAPVRITKLRPTPATGTHTVPIPHPGDAPVPANRLTPDDDVTVYRNDPSMPPVDESACNFTDTGSIDPSPILDLDYGAVFPFGIFAWVGDQWDAINVTAEAPNWTIPVHGYGGWVEDWEIDLEPFSPYMAIMRTVLAWMLWVGSVWYIGTSLLGIRGSGNPADAIDDYLDQVI